MRLGQSEQCLERPAAVTQRSSACYRHWPFRSRKSPVTYLVIAPQGRTVSCGGQVEAGIHVKAEPPVRIDVRPEQRRQPPPVFPGEFPCPGRVTQDRLEELGLPGTDPARPGAAMPGGSCRAAPPGPGRAAGWPGPGPHSASACPTGGLVASVRSLERYARPGPEAVARHVAAADPAARRRQPQ